MQDLTEHARDVDLDAALQQTYERHSELARARDRKRRLAFGGGVAAVVVLVVAALPVFLANDDDGTVGVADDGSDVAPVEVAPQVSERVVPDDFELTIDGDVWILTRDPASVIDRDGVDAGEVQLGAAVTEVRAAEVAGIETGPQPDVVTVSFVCVGDGDQLQLVRYRLDDDVLVVRGDVLSGADPAACSAGGAGASIALPLPNAYVPGTDVVVDPAI